MSVKELIAYQEQTKRICLHKQGLFFRGYNSGALMLEKLMGYKVNVVFLKSCGMQLCSAGFPSDNLEKVKVGIERQGGKILKANHLMIEIEGLDFPCNETIVESYGPPIRRPLAKKRLATPPAPATLAEQVAAKLLGYNMSNATPLEAMLFLDGLQRSLRTEVN